MSRYRLLAMGTMFMFALTTVAQQAGTKSGSEDAGLPTVEEQLKVLTEKLDLTGDQQVKVKRILQELHDATERLARDKGLSHEERLAKVQPQRHKAEEKIRTFLNDGQKKKLDQYLKGPHPEMHGNLSGATPPSTKPPQR